MNNTKKKNRAATNIARMVFLNGCLCFSLRIFELLFNTVNIAAMFQRHRSHSKDVNDTKQLVNFWLLTRYGLRNVGECFYTLTFIFPIFFYYRFNSFFRIELQKLVVKFACACSLFYFTLKLKLKFVYS